MSDYAFFCAAEEGDLELVSSMLAAEPDLLHAKDCSDLIVRSALKIIIV